MKRFFVGAFYALLLPFVFVVDMPQTWWAWGHHFKAHYFKCVFSFCLNSWFHNMTGRFDLRPF